MSAYHQLLLIALCGLSLATAQVPELGTSAPPSDGIDLQTQIYVIISVGGILILLLVILVLALAILIARIKNQLASKPPSDFIHKPNSGNQDNKSPEVTGNNGTINAYVNEGFTNRLEMEERRREPQMEVDRLGYDVYSGRQTSENRNPVESNVEVHHRFDDDDNTTDGIQLKRYSSRKLHQSQKERSDRAKKFYELNKDVVDGGNMFKKPTLRNSHFSRPKPTENRHHHLNMDESVAPRTSPIEYTNRREYRPSERCTYRASTLSEKREYRNESPDSPPDYPKEKRNYVNGSPERRDYRLQSPDQDGQELLNERRDRSRY